MYEKFSFLCPTKLNTNPYVRTKIHSEKTPSPIEILHNNNIKSGIITKENSKIVKQRTQKIKPDLVLIGIQKKELELPKICKKFNISNNQIAYIGDDINDLSIMNLVGFSACPKDAVDEIKKISDYISNYSGGSGVLREISDLIISIQNRSKIK